MRAIAIVTLLLAWATTAFAIYVPPGLQPGDHYQIAFVTSFTTGIDTDTSVPPSFPSWGGVTAADYLVTDAAASSGVIDNWNFSDITCHAILSSTTVDAKDRAPILGPVYNTHGELVATDAADMWDGTIDHAIQYDEFGDGIPSNFNVWTGTAANGRSPAVKTGLDWDDPTKSELVGNLLNAGSGWLQAFSLSGSSVARLYGVSPQLTVPLQGDYNSDGIVDAADYVVWRNSNGPASDYDVWRAHFGESIGASGSAIHDSDGIPEPSFFVLLTMSVAILLSVGAQRGGLTRITMTVVVCLVAGTAPLLASPPVPSGLNPGDHYQIAFVTSFFTNIDTDTSVPPSYPGWGGVTAADYLVTDAAASAGLLDNWNFSDITWHAILSNSTSNAIDHAPILGPVYNTHGELVASDSADMWDGSLDHAIQYDEFGDGIPSNFSVWTGTSSATGAWTGASAGQNWNNPALLASTGILSKANVQWCNAGTTAANSTARLYGVSPLLTVPLPGDFNNDGVVDSADYVVWRDTNGPAANYDIWRTHFGESNGASGSEIRVSDAIPEPSYIALATMAGVILLSVGARGRGLARISTVIACLLAATTPLLAQTIVPSGLNPGDHYQIAFVTSFETEIDTDTSVPPSFPFWGGVDAADYTVTNAAASAGYIPNWNFSDITWHAILSNSTSNAIDRVPILGPVYNTHGELVASDSADMWDGSLDHAIQYDEFGGGIPSNFSVWTGTNSVTGAWTTGSAGANWNNPAGIANYGNLSKTNVQWCNAGSEAANSISRLYGISPLLTVPGLLGDYNNDGIVNAADYVVWRNNNGPASDYDLWRAHFGQSISGSGSSVESASVPEPVTLALLFAAASVLLPSGSRSARRFK